MPYDVVHLAAVLRNPPNTYPLNTLTRKSSHLSPLRAILRGKPQVLHRPTTATILDPVNNPRHPTLTNFQAMSHLTNPNPALAHPTRGQSTGCACLWA